MNSQGKANKSVSVSNNLTNIIEKMLAHPNCLRNHIHENPSVICSIQAYILQRYQRHLVPMRALSNNHNNNLRVYKYKGIVMFITMTVK